MRQLSAGVTETVYDGHLTSNVFAASDAEFWRVSGMRAVPYSILDATAISGFDGAIAESAVPAFGLFRERGGKEYLMVTASPTLRMMGAALAASCRVGLRVFETRGAALDYLKGIGAW